MNRIQRFSGICMISLILGLGLLTSAFAGDVAEGSWTKKGFAIAGGWSIVERDGEHIVVLDGGFKTKKGPDLKIFLSPLPLEEIDGQNATKGSVFVGALHSAKGTQELRIPAGTDLQRYQTILIHCERYSKLWGGASLR